MIAVDLADTNLQLLANWGSDPDFKAKCKIIFVGCEKMFDQSFLKSKDFGDMLRFLLGVLVQNGMSMQGETDLYLSGFLRDRDQFQLYHCDPMLQHISISRHFLSLLDRSHAFQFDLQWYSRLLILSF